MGAMRHTPHGTFVNMWDENVEEGRAYLEAAWQLILCKVRCTFKILSFTSFRRDDKMGRGAMYGEVVLFIGVVALVCVVILPRVCVYFVASAE